MKYLDGYPELDLLARALSFSSPSLRVSTRVEAYSCKAVRRENKLFKTLENDLLNDLTFSTSISPPEHHSALLGSAFGPLDKKESRKTLYLLIATLNLAFPDHDFSRVAAEEFAKEDSARGVLSSLSSALSHLRSSGSDASYYRSFSSYPPSSTVLPGFAKQPPSPRTGYQFPASFSSAYSRFRHTGEMEDLPTHPFLRQVLDPIIELGDCEVYSYNPDIDSDPHAYQSEDEEEEFSGEDDEIDTMQMDDELDWKRGLNEQSKEETPSLPSTPSQTKRHKRNRSLSRKLSTFGDFDEDGTDADETGGLLWSSNYFFFNRKMKRILFISCWGRKASGVTPTSMDKLAASKPVPRAFPSWSVSETTSTTSASSAIDGSTQPSFASMMQKVQAASASPTSEKYVSSPAATSPPPVRSAGAMRGRYKRSASKSGISSRSSGSRRKVARKVI